MDKAPLFTPHHHTFHGFVGLLNDGLGVVDALSQIGAAAALAVVFFAAAMWRFKFE